MADFTLDDLDADILEFFSDEIELRRMPEEDEFTSRAFWEYVNKKEGVDITRKTARAWLDKAVRGGKAEMRAWRNAKGQDTNLYRWRGK